MLITPKIRSIMIGAGLLFAGIAIDRGIHFVNWQLVKMGISGEPGSVCTPEMTARKNSAPTQGQGQASYTDGSAAPGTALLPSVTSPSVTAYTAKAPIALPELTPTPMRQHDDLPIVKSLGIKPTGKSEASPGKDKEKEEPAVNVDLTRGRKEQSGSTQK